MINNDITVKEEYNTINYFWRGRWNLGIKIIKEKKY